MLAVPGVCQDDCVFNPSVPGTISAFLESKFQPPPQLNGLWGNTAGILHPSGTMKVISSA